MKKIVAINCSLRATWNTATLVREAAKGAEGEAAEVTGIDLYKLEKFTGLAASCRRIQASAFAGMVCMLCWKRCGMQMVSNPWE